MVKILVAVLAVVCAGELPGYAQERLTPLPLPSLKVSELPPLVPTAITAGGQRRLLSDTDVEVRYDAERKRLVVNRPEWWIINYPLTRIKGLEPKKANDIAQLLFGKPAQLVRNWYVKTPGMPEPEPPAPTGPAPIDLTPNPTLTVNTRHPNAHDSNSGSSNAPLKTIAAAIKRAQPGAVIHVYPGIYRESVSLRQSGTPEQPIRLEGVRDQDGSLPVISGNDPFTHRAWKAVAGFVGVYRADLFTKRLGTVSANGRTLIERSLPGELREGEFCLNHASQEFLRLHLDSRAMPQPGELKDGRSWRRLTTDDEGFLDLGKAYGAQARQAVFWASTYVWVPPRTTSSARNMDTPQPITGRLVVDGEFRAARLTGAALAAQVNKYRVRVNGQLLPAVIYSTAEDPQMHLPRPSRNGGTADQWEGFMLREGWNHLVFQFDTTARPDKTRFRFGVPKGVGMQQGIIAVVTSATNPSQRDRPTAGHALPYVSEYLVLGPYAATPDMGVYVRLPGNADPNAVAMDLAARGSTLVSIHGDFVRVRGFEIRHGAQFQQLAQVELRGTGILLEGNLIRDSEVAGIAFSADQDQTAAPIIIRDNWVVNPGNLGIGGKGTSDRLTPANQNTSAPGRTPVLIEHNTVSNSNWAGFSPGWEAGGMKLFRLTGAVIRYNTIIGGSGPGIWLDWEHYGNRVEGNLLRHVYGYSVGVEASPGPNVVANNLSVDLRPGWDWARAAILSWDSTRTWAVNNSLDGRWNPTIWGRFVGTIGIDLGQGGRRDIRWGPLLEPQQALSNNLIVGSQTAVLARKPHNANANYTEKGAGAASSEVVFRNPAHEDYRLQPDNPLNRRGTADQYTALVRHDFYGLLRFPDVGRTVGAFRWDAHPMRNTETLVEVEYQDGQLRRLYEIVR